MSRSDVFAGLYRPYVHSPESSLGARHCTSTGSTGRAAKLSVMGLCDSAFYSLRIRALYAIQHSGTPSSISLPGVICQPRWLGYPLAIFSSGTKPIRESPLESLEQVSAEHERRLLEASRGCEGRIGSVARTTRASRLGGSHESDRFAMRRPITTLMLVVALISGGASRSAGCEWISSPRSHAEDLRLSRLHWHEPRPDRGLHRQPARAVLSVRRWHPGDRFAEHPAGRLVPALVFPGTDMGQAMAQVVAMSDRAMSWMPKGTLPPMIMRMDSGSVRSATSFSRARRPRWARWATWRRTSSGRWCKNSSRARWRSRRSARTCGRS